MGTTELELRRAAERDRARMGDTLEAIGDRLSPERVVERRKAAMGQGFRRMREAVMGSPEYVEPVTQRARDQAQQAQQAASSVASSATDAARTVADTVQHAPQVIADQARGNPIAAGVVAFGFGMLMATAFPKTRTEQQLVGAARPQLDLAKEELRDTGRQLASDVKEHAQNATQELRSAGQEAASNVADQAKSSAQSVAQEARNS